MSFDADEEILQDFLVEAGEILEQLSEQLVELESRPDDMDLLNAIFRGFHTVKGGAGFLQLNALVECCHIAENVFDILRKGERRVSSELMDVVLQALDTVNAMFDQVREQSEPTPATPELLAALARLAEPEGAEPRNLCKRRRRPFRQPSLRRRRKRPRRMPPAISPTTSSSSCWMLCRATKRRPPPLQKRPRLPLATRSATPSSRRCSTSWHGKGKFVPPVVSAEPAQVPAEAVEPPAAAAGDDISDDEFEALLDELHGKGKFGDVPEAAGTPAAPAAAAPAAAPAEQGKAPAAAGGDEISDDEFESLLDELHGKGKFNGASEAVAAAAAVARTSRRRVPRRNRSLRPRPPPRVRRARQARGKRGGDHRAGGYGASRRDHEHGRRAGAGA